MLTNALGVSRRNPYWLWGLTLSLDFEGFSGLYVIPATVVPELLEKWQPTSGPNGESVVDQKMKERRRKSDRYTKNLSFHHWRVDTLFSLRRREILEKAWCEKHVCSSKGSVQQICDPEAKHFQTKAEKEMCILCWPQQNSTAMDVYCTRVGNAAARTLLGLAGLLILAIVGCFGCLLPSMLRRRKRTVMRRISRKAARDRTMPSKLSWYQKLTSILRPGSHDRKIVSARPGDYPQKKVPNMPPAIKLSPMTDGAPPGEDSNGEGSQIGTACRSASKPRASGSSIEEDRSRVVDRKVTEADHADADVVPGSSRASAHRSHSGD